MAGIDADKLRRKREKLEAELEALRVKERSAEDERYAIAGRAVLKHAEKHTAFAQELVRILDMNLSKRRERKLFDLVGGTAEPVAEAAPAASQNDVTPQ